MTRLAFLLFAASLIAVAQPPSTPAKSFASQFEDINNRLLAMAKDFPEDKYSYRATKDVRSFREIIVHVASGNAYAAKAGKGEKANWDEIDPKGYTTKAAAVALLEKTIADATATLKATPEDRWAKTVQPWLAVIEHAGEHYGQLVVYYRNNAMVPPESRQTPKR